MVEFASPTKTRDAFRAIDRFQSDDKFQPARSRDRDLDPFAARPGLHVVKLPCRKPVFMANPTNATGRGRREALHFLPSIFKSLDSTLAPLSPPNAHLPSKSSGQPFTLVAVLV